MLASKSFFLPSISLLTVYSHTLATAVLAWSNLTSENIGQRDKTASSETARRHALEIQKRDLAAVQVLENKLNIAQRWEQGSLEWRTAAEKVSMRTYQRCIDVLEGLVVARMFELTKMNRSQTGMSRVTAVSMLITTTIFLGYSLRKHIANALKARSTAIRTALDRYNASALALVPPRQVLTWDQIVEYVFLSDFDLLRDTRQDIRTKPWATPAARLAIDRAFKLERAEEEVARTARLNIEVTRLATYIRDEDICLRAKEAELSTSRPALAHQVGIHRMERGRFNAHHLLVLDKIYHLNGFTGHIGFGTRAAEAPSTTQEDSFGAAPPPTGIIPNLGDDDEQDLDEEQAGEDEEVEVLGAFCSLLHMSIDTSRSL